MSLIDQITRWLGINSAEATETVQTHFSRSNELKYQGHYPDALAELDNAEAIIPHQHKQLKEILQLQRAKLLMHLAQYDDAQATLRSLQERASEPAMEAHALNVLGQIAQARQQWEDARQHYEQALKIARETGAQGAEGRAQGFLADTYVREDNISFALYLLQEALPKVKRNADVELDSYFSGRLGEALIQVGREGEGQAYLGRALRIAEKLQHAEYELLWRRALADQAMAIGNYTEARRHYMLVLAASDQSEPTYPITLCRLSKACLRLMELDAALDYARQAIELTEPQEDDAHLMAQAAYGIAQRGLGHFREAIPPLERAALHYLELPRSGADYSYVDVLRNLAAALAETGSMDSAEAIYQQALDHARSTEENLDIAGTYRDMGILYTRKGDFKAAIKTWTDALKIYENTGELARVARLYSDIANIRKQQGEGQLAMRDYEQALMLLSSINDLDTRGLILSNAATAYVDQGDIETAESFFEEAIKIAQKTHDRHAEATRRGNYGWFLMSTGRAKRALATLAYALRQSENLGLNLTAAVQTDNIGLAHDELGEYEQALACHQEALARLNGLDAPYWQATFQANIAHTLIALGRIEEAATHIEPAHTTGQTLKNAEILARVSLARAKTALHQSEDAFPALEETIAQANYASKRRLLADALTLRSDAYARAGKTEDAQADWERAKSLLQVMHIQPETHQPDWIKSE